MEHGKRCTRCAKNNRPRKEPQGPCPLKGLSAAGKTADLMKQKDLAGSEELHETVQDGDEASLPAYDDNELQLSSKEEVAGDKQSHVGASIKDELPDELGRESDAAEQEQDRGRKKVKSEAADSAKANDDQMQWVHIKRRRTRR